MSDSDSHRGGASLPAAPLSDKQVAVVRKICDNYPDFTKKGNIGSISPVEALINELSLDKPDPEKFERHFYESREPWGAPYWNQLGNDPRSHTEKADRPKKEAPRLLYAVFDYLLQEPDTYKQLKALLSAKYRCNKLLTYEDPARNSRVNPSVKIPTYKPFVLPASTYDDAISYADWQKKTKNSFQVLRVSHLIQAHRSVVLSNSGKDHKKQWNTEDSPEWIKEHTKQYITGIFRETLNQWQTLLAEQRIWLLENTPDSFYDNIRTIFETTIKNGETESLKAFCQLPPDNPHRPTQKEILSLLKINIQSKNSSIGLVFEFFAEKDKKWWALPFFSHFSQPDAPLPAVILTEADWKMLYLTATESSMISALREFFPKTVRTQMQREEDF